MATKKPASKKSKASSKPKKATRSTRVTTPAKHRAPAKAAPVPAPVSKPIPMGTFLFMILAGALFICGFFIGLLAGMGDGHDANHHSVDLHGHEGSAHSHEAVDISNQEPLPSIEISVFQDAVSGYNLRLMLTNFEIVPEHASTVFLPNEGHAHLYINGKKSGRIYGEWFHIPDLPSGTHEITVTLNSHDHKDLIVLGQKVQATTMITVE